MYAIVLGYSFVMCIDRFNFYLLRRWSFPSTPLSTNLRVPADQIQKCGLKHGYALCRGVKYNLFTITINRRHYYEHVARIQLNGVG